MGLCAEMSCWYMLGLLSVVTLAYAQNTWWVDYLSARLELQQSP